MAWTVYFDPILDADLTTTTGKSIRFKTSTKHRVMTHCQTGVCFSNVGAFSSLCLKLYSDRDGNAGALIATSTNSYNKADVLETYDNGIKFLVFTFENISLNKDTYYHFLLSASGYTFSESSFMGWIKAWPDPVYGQPVSWNDLDNNSYIFALLGKTL